MSLYPWTRYDKNKTRTTLDDYSDQMKGIKARNRLVKNYRVEKNFLSPDKMVTMT